MTIREVAFLLVACAVGVLPFCSVWASTNDRVYLLGDHVAPPTPNEGASNGAAVGSGNGFGTLDSEGLNGLDQLPPLVPKGTSLPVYRTITGRPDGGGGLGIEFTGSQSQYVHGQSLNLPEASLSAIGGDFPGTINYNGINNRGMQFWVRPGAGAAAAQSVVLDSNQHGVRITGGGNFSMRYAGSEFDTTVPATPGTWYHLMVVRPAGTGGGSRMYINGIAAAAAPGGYDGTDQSNLVIGSNTGGGDGFDDMGQPDPSNGFTGGTGEYFTGIVDDLTMFVIGDNSANAGPPPGQNWGAFNFATDNAFAAFTLSGEPGDLDGNGVLNDADKQDFISGWMTENLVNNIRVGDVNTFANGDLNVDGITNIFDLVLMQDALMGVGLGAITAAELAGSSVPEPTSVLLVGIVVALCGARRIR